MGEPRLCYMMDNVMYFTDDFEGQWGDDWNDAPYQCNAGTPYSWRSDLTEEENRAHGYGHITYVGFVADDVWVKEAWERGNVSVQDVNKGAVPWLYADGVAVHGGDELSVVKDKLTKMGVKWGVLC